MRKTKNNKSNKTAKTLTVSQLKAWLRGIQEFQPADWTPSKEQWQAIRDKIMNLDETELAQVQTYVEEPEQQRYYNTIPVETVRMPSSLASAPMMPSGPVGGGIVGGEGIVDVRPGGEAYPPTSFA